MLGYALALVAASALLLAWQKRRRLALYYAFAAAAAKGKLRRPPSHAYAFHVSPCRRYCRISHHAAVQRVIFVPFDAALQKRLLGKRVLLEKADGSTLDVTHPPGVPYLVPPAAMGGVRYLVENVEGEREELFPDGKAPREKPGAPSDAPAAPEAGAPADGRPSP